MQVEIYNPPINPMVYTILVDPPSNVAFPSPQKNLAEPGIHFLLTKPENRGAWHWNSRRLSVIHDLPMEGANCEGPGKPTNQHGRTEPTERYKKFQASSPNPLGKVVNCFSFQQTSSFSSLCATYIQNQYVYIYIYIILFQLVPVCFGVSSEVSSPLLTPLWTCRKLCSLQIRKRPGIFPAIFLWMDS